MSIASESTEIEYPDSDGNPMAENTLQFEWITTLMWNFNVLFKHDPNVFVAGDLLWYPVEGDNKTRQAPDTMIVFGRHKGYRGSYMQWRENQIPPQVVFEVLSPGNRVGEMRRKRFFYEQYGVEEYYVYDPDDPTLEVWIRRDDALEKQRFKESWVSPMLGTRFVMTGETMEIFKPDGSRFLTFPQLDEENALNQARADAESSRADAESSRADAESLRADVEAKRAADAETRTERLQTRLRELGEKFEID